MKLKPIYKFILTYPKNGGEAKREGKIVRVDKKTWQIKVRVVHNGYDSHKNRDSKWEDYPPMTMKDIRIKLVQLVNLGGGILFWGGEEDEELWLCS